MEHLAIRTMTAPLLRLALIVACVTALGVALVSTAHAQTAPRPSLRASITVHGNVVTIGDFFENPGSLGPTPLFRPPDIGQTGTIDAWQVIDAAQKAGLSAASTNGVRTVSVTRAGIEISADRITNLIARSIAERIGLSKTESISVSYTSLPHLLQADAASAEPLRLAALSWSRASGGFSATLLIDRGDGTRRERISGTAIEMRDVIVPARTIDKDTIIGRDDVVVQKIPRAQADARYATQMDDVLGLAPRRALRAGQPISTGDIAEPQLVKRGEAVTLIYQVPGLTLSARGQAMESGTDGDMVNVLNSQSRRIVRGTVIGRGKVQIISSKQKLIKMSEASR